MSRGASDGDTSGSHLQYNAGFHRVQQACSRVFDGADCKRCLANRFTSCDWLPFQRPSCSACSQLRWLLFGGGGNRVGHVGRYGRSEAARCTALRSDTGKGQRRSLLSVPSVENACGVDDYKVTAAAHTGRSSVADCVIDTSALIDCDVTMSCITASKHQGYSSRHLFNAHAATMPCFARTS